jgi:glucose-6-phosphate 1-dehydrogenase
MKYLIHSYEENSQIKRTKLTGLELKFENFRIEDGETLEDIYTRLMHIQNKFIELGEPLSNDKLAEKLLRVLLRKPMWEDYVSALDAMQGVNVTFTMDELYALLHSFEEKLKQAGDCQ